MPTPRPAQPNPRMLPAILFAALVLIGIGIGCATHRSKPTATSTTTSAMRLLRDNCLSCHNADKSKGGLVLGSRKGLLNGGDNGPVIAEGKPDESELFKVLSADADPHMPPKKQLTSRQIQIVKDWIIAGAGWDQAALEEKNRREQVQLTQLPDGYQPALAVALSPDGQRLAIGRGNRLIVHDLQATNFPVLFDTNVCVDAVRSVVWSPDGHRLASGSYRELTVRNADDFAIVWQASSNLMGRVSALAFTPHGGALVAADSPTAEPAWVRVFAADSGREIDAWIAHDDAINAVAISPDGGRLATAGGDKLVKLWEIISHNEIARYEGHVGAVTGIGFDTNATELLSVGADKQLKVWDVKSREGVVTIGGRRHSFTAGAWSADGKTVAATDEDGRLYTFKEFQRHGGAQSSETAKERQLGRWSDALTAVAINADGSRIAAGGQDGIVRVVDGEGKLLATLEPKPTITGMEDGTAETKEVVREASAGVGSNANSSTSVPLTPALSPKEKEKGGQPLNKSGARSSSDGAKGNSLTAGERGKVTHELRAGSNSIEIVEAVQPVPSFVRDVLPALAKAGCMAGSCHAKPEGQNGFKLSVFSYNPPSDYAEIVKDGRGRRVSPAAPPESLILLKPTLAVDHEGGQRIEPGSETYQLLTRWIAGGLPYQATNEPTLTGIQVEPAEGSYKLGGSVALKVAALYSDHSTRDVTRLAEFVSQDKELATVDEAGKVQVGKLSGESVVIARFMGFVDAAHLTVPADRILPPERYRELPVANFIDERAYAHFQKLGLYPSARCTDEEFIRRSTLDAIGMLPTPEETRVFVADTTPDKRRKWIEQLVQHPAWADYWANKWADLLRPNPDRVGVKSVYLLDQWLREAFRQNLPFDQFARAIITAEGSNHHDGPAVVYRDRREPPELTTMFSQLFLGVRLECAKCHHHPNEKWSQDDFYQFAAFFGPVKQKGAGLSPPISAGTEVFYFAPGGDVRHPLTDAVVKPRPPDAAEFTAADDRDPRLALADWLTNPDNSFFAKSAVNRVWASFFGRGMVEPVDDFRASNPAVNEPLLDALAADFREHGYDLKHLMRTILSSELYQLSSTPNDTNLADTKHFSRSYRRRLPAEVALDAVSDVTGVPDKFDGCPPGTRAIQTWTFKINSNFLDAFGRPNASSDAPCERDLKTSVVQALHLMNSQALQAKLADASGRVKALTDSDRSPAAIVHELYLATFSRLPTDAELATATAEFAKENVKRQDATEDVLWALLNSPEFVFNH